MRGRGISQRISMLVAAAVFTAVALVTAIFAYNDVTSDFAARKRAFEATAYVFASAIAEHVAEHDTQGSLKVLRSISRIPDISYAAVLDRDGRAFASLGSAIVMDAGELKSDIGILEALRTGFYPVAVDIIKSGEKIGQVLLIVRISELRDQLLEVVLTSLFVAFSAIAISFLLAHRLQRNITDPIRSLIEAMRDVSASRTYDRQVKTAAEGETGQLVGSFNAMISEIRGRDEALAKHRQTLESTVEQRTQELRLARDAAESANQAKTSFLATMSHEIRTPLNGLMVMAELLAGAGLDQRLQRYAEVIVKSGQSLLTIINDILDLSKIEAGKLELEVIPLNPASIADDVTSLYWERAASTGLDLAARVAPGVPRLILGDPVRLNQILSNLVNNALKFTERGQVLVSLHHDKGQLTFSVSDSSTGIPQKKLNLLFQAFSQADQTITRKFGGTGLGLAICKRLAEAMGGTIGVKSQLGQGSTFWFSIPAGAQSEPVPFMARPPLAMSAAIAVDGLASQSALGTALAAAGLRVTVIADETAGHGVVFATAPRLRRLRHAGAQRPRVICLGSLGDSDGETTIAEGLADDLIILPLRQQDMAEMIGRLRNNTLRGLNLLERRGREPDRRASFKGRHVLVADDNAVNREVIIEVLRQLDITVQVAVNGLDALEQWRKQQPDLIFMDCSMPEMDGYAATREIRAHEHLAVAGGHTPIIALTAHVAGNDGETWRKAGMDAYMTKPFTLKQIASCLETQFTGLPPVPDSAPPAVVPGTVLDAEVLNELRNIGGSDALFRRVLDLFASRVPQAVDKVSALAIAEDAAALADAAHALKSMCANIGAHAAVAACHDLEFAARTSQDLDAGALVGAIIGEMRNVMSEVERLRAA